MEEKDFWKIIDAARRKAKGDLEALPDHVASALARRDAKEIVAFEALLGKLLGEARRPDLRGAAHLLTGGVDDAGFEAFGAWLISRGEKTFRAALEDPDSLASEVKEDDEGEYDCEELLYAASVAHEEATGAPLPPAKAKAAAKPAGKPVDEDRLEEHYPKIARAMGLSEHDHDSEDEEDLDDEDDDDDLD